MSSTVKRSKVWLRQFKATALAVAVIAGGVSIANVSNALGVRPATYSGTNGPLVYVSSSGFGPSRTISLKASTLDGVAVPVTLDATQNPQFSADGSKAVWLETGGSAWAIKSANSDGSNKVTVISGSSSPNANNPTFSTTGNFIAFDYDNDIYVISANFTGKTISDAIRIVDSSGAGVYASKPQYISATKIAYLGSQPTNACSSSMYAGIYVKDTTVAGNGTLLTNSCDAGSNRTFPMDFDVSPDGQWIVYRGLDVYRFIALIKSDNSGSRISVYSATSGPSQPEAGPVFSPDGSKIAYDTSSNVKVVTFDGTTVGSPTTVTFPAGVNTPAGITWAPSSAVLSAGAATTTVAPTTTATPATTTAPTTTTTVVQRDPYANAVPGVTVTDTKVYATAPAKVASASAIDVLTPAQAKTSDIVSQTPSVCLPNDEDLVFIDEGRCIAQVVNEKTRKVLRTLRTTVVEDDISTLKVGNEIAVLSPLYFSAGTSSMKLSSLRRLNTLVPQVKAAGSILVAGHSGVLMGDTVENRALSRQRANTVVAALKKRGATADFAIAAVGALDPVSTGDSQKDQDKNRRAVIVLIP